MTVRKADASVLLRVTMVPNCCSLAKRRWIPFLLGFIYLCNLNHEYLSNSMIHSDKNRYYIPEYSGFIDICVHGTCGIAFPGQYQRVFRARQMARVPRRAEKTCVHMAAL